MVNHVSRSIIGHAQLRAPPQLNENERKVFAEVVTSVRQGHFELCDMAMLVEFSRLTILVNELWKKYNDSGEAEDLNNLNTTEKMLFNACRLLRLTPSSRAPNVPSREAHRRSAAHSRTAASGSIYDQMEAMTDGGA